MNSQPQEGDVLIESEGLHYHLSIVPFPSRVAFKQLTQATSMARRWWEVDRLPSCKIWLRLEDGTLEPVVPDVPDAERGKSSSDTTTDHGR